MVPTVEPGLVRWARPGAEQLVVEALSLQQLHGNEGLAAIVFQGVNRADVGMVQRRSGARFEQEAVERGGITGKFRRKKLEGHTTAEGQVLGFVDHAHPAAAQLTDDAVVRDGLADHERSSTSGNSSYGRVAGAVKPALHE